MTFTRTNLCVHVTKLIFIFKLVAKRHKYITQFLLEQAAETCSSTENFGILIKRQTLGMPPNPLGEAKNRKRETNSCLVSFTRLKTKRSVLLIFTKTFFQEGLRKSQARTANTKSTKVGSRHFLWPDRSFGNFGHGCCHSDTVPEQPKSLPDTLTTQNSVSASGRFAERRTQRKKRGVCLFKGRLFHASPSSSLVSFVMLHKSKTHLIEAKQGCFYLSSNANLCVFVTMFC